MFALLICTYMLVGTGALYALGYVLGKARDRKFLAYADKLAKEAAAGNKRGPRSV